MVWNSGRLISALALTPAPTLRYQRLRLRAAKTLGGSRAPSPSGDQAFSSSAKGSQLAHEAGIGTHRLTRIQISLTFSPLRWLSNRSAISPCTAQQPALVISKVSEAKSCAKPTSALAGTGRTTSHTTPASLLITTSKPPALMSAKFLRNGCAKLSFQSAKATNRDLRLRTRCSTQVQRLEASLRKPPRKESSAR